jgi:uncharacterized protein YndB with AHSA1/START domain
VSTTRVTRHINATRPAVYAALLDRDAVRHWMVPDDMTSRVHVFEPHEGGRFRISLTYDAPTDAGKTDAQSDTFRGRFARLVPDQEVVQIVEFETDDPGLQGEMTITYALADATGGGTELIGRHEGLPPGVRPETDDPGWRMSIDKLARLVEAGGQAPT